MNEIYNNLLILYTSLTIRIAREPYISINKLCSYDLEKKYKRCYNTSYFI